MYHKGIRLRTRPPTKEEERFLHASEVGDIPTVRRLLHQYQDLDVNCTDILGRTPLRLAVENEHEEVVALLLDKTDVRHMYEALLLAISLDHDEIAGVILKHPTYEQLEHSSNNLFTLLPEDSQFSAETTPLILAAQRNRFEIVSFLIRKGQRIEKPHLNHCNCPLCCSQVALDELRYAQSRLNSYKGLASDSYISLSSEDPILSAFQLSQELREVAQIEKHYRFEYEALRKKLSEFVVHLLDHVRGNDELDILLNEHKGAALESSVKMARLKLAIKYNEKQFVTHASCTKMLTSKFYGDQKFFQHLPWLLQMLFALALTPLFPILAVIYWIAPNSKVGYFLRTPVIQFLGQTMSFLTFLTLVVTFSFSERPSGGSVENATRFMNLDSYKTYFAEFEPNLTGIYRHLDKLQLRQFYPGPTQMVICLWIVGMLWQEMKQLYGEGLQGYVAHIFNVIDFVSIKMYILSFTLRYLSFVKTTYALKYFCTRDAWERLSRNDSQATYHAYWLISDRFFWDATDPMNICEGIFSVANVLSFTRLMYLLAASAQLGPLQISLRRMGVDISKFMVIFLIVFVAFLVGLNNLYWYYRPVKHANVNIYSEENLLRTIKPLAFGEWLSKVDNIFRTMFWALFGMGEPDVVEKGMSFGASNADQDSDEVSTTISFRDRVGYIMYGGYNMAAVIVLLNMLIAMMSRSYNKIQNDAHMEWKFARARMYMEYIAEGSTLPPPLNIVPSPKSIFRILFPFIKCCPRDSAEKHFNTRERQYVPYGSTPRGSRSEEFQTQRHRTSRSQSSFGESACHGLDAENEESSRNTRLKTKEEMKMTYQSVIKSILKRYIFGFQQDNSLAPEAEILELKQDLSSLRYEVFNALSDQSEAFHQAISNLSNKVDTSCRFLQRSSSSTPPWNYDISHGPLSPDVFVSPIDVADGRSGLPVVEEVIVPKRTDSEEGAYRWTPPGQVRHRHPKIRGRKSPGRRKRFTRTSLTFIWEI